MKSYDRRDTTYWDCIKVRDKEYKARSITSAITSANNIKELIVLKGPDRFPHTHPFDREMITAEKIKQNIKKKAEANLNLMPPVMVRDELAGSSHKVLVHLPERENLKKGIRRKRAENTPANPKSLADLDEISELYTKTVSGDNFLLYDSKANDKVPDGRVLVFYTKRNLEILRECNVWFADGNFEVIIIFFYNKAIAEIFFFSFSKVLPNIFTQVFTILGNVTTMAGNTNPGRVTLPLVYSLLSSKEQIQNIAVYNAIISEADDFNNGMEPKTITSDFERANINAVFEGFENCSMQLCYFHLKHFLYRHVQSLGLQVAYNNADNSTVGDFCHKLASLA